MSASDAGLALLGITGLREIGAGGSATALAGRDAAGRDVVVKLFFAPDDPRAAREAAILAALQSPARGEVPLAPALFDSGELDDGRPFLLLERIDRPSLAPCPGSPAAPARVAALVTAAASAVDRLHQRGIVHRDLKPAHVFPWRDSATLVDFALARHTGTGTAALAPELTRAGDRPGTAHYMAPEQCRGAEDVSPAADRYALAVIAFELLTGRRLFGGSAAEIRTAHAAARPPRVSASTELPAEVDAVMARALAKDPDRRYPRASDFAAELKAALSAPRRRGAAAIAAPATAPATWQQTAAVALRCADTVLDVQRAASPAVLVHADGDRAVLALAPGPPLSRSVEIATGIAAQLARILALRGPALVTVAEVRAGRRRLRLRQPERALAELAAVASQRGAHLGAAARAVAPRAQPTPGADGPRPLRGRDDVLAALCEHRHRAPGIATVLGEPGTGKSHLLRELSRRLERDGWPVWQLDPVGSAGALAARARQAPRAAGKPSRALAARGLADALVAAAAQRALTIVVDDAHRADPIALDALELATAATADLWVCAAAPPTLRDSRPSLTDGERRACHVLAPLAPEAARQVVRDLLATEFVPDETVSQLCARAGGLPLYLVELAHALSAAGPAVHVPAELLAHLHAEPVAARGARQALDRLPDALCKLAVACTALGDEIDAAELDRLVDRLGGDWLDPGVGLERLARAHLLADAGAGRYRFRHPIVRRAIEATAPPDELARLHRAALELVDASGAPDLARVAVHAEAAGLPARARAAHFELAQRARARHAPVDAELAYSAALRLAGDDVDRLRASWGRSSVRYQVHRLAEALEDAARAREVARRLGRRRDEVELALLESMILDWSFDLPASAQRAREARELAAALDAPELEPALRAAEGRAAYRREDLPRAVELLASAADGARDADHGTRVAALLLLAPSLLLLDRPAEAEARYAEVIAACEEAGDDLHLAAACSNRQFLWMRRGQMQRAAADLRRAIELARRLGNAAVERFASHNLAELLYWCGDADGALPLARRSSELMHRFAGGHDVPDEALLMARIHCARGQNAAARSELEAVRELVEAPEATVTARRLRDMLDLVLDGGSAADWDELDRRFAGLAPELGLELCLWAAQSAADPERAAAWLDRARRRGGDAAPWRARIERIRAVVAGAT